jgi:hypothetical protein
MSGIAVALFVGLTVARSAVAQELKPYTIDWSRAAESVVSHAHFLSAPAGRDGLVTVDGDRMYTPDGKRFRVWGVNLTGPNCFPDKAVAPQIADDLARLGVNCVRFHHWDATWGRNIFDATRDDTRRLDPESLDRLDFFVAELKKRGIYSNLNLNVSRRFKAGDGVRDHTLIGYAKGATYFNARLIELQHEFARQILTHRNAYTGNEYRHEPAVAVIEIVNENSLLEAWAGWRLIGKDDPKKDETWGPIPVSYDRELSDLYNQWLTTAAVAPDDLAAIRKEAGVDPAAGRVPRLISNQFAKASKLRFATEARFLMSVEQQFFIDFRKLLKDGLGVKSLLVGSADHNDGISGYPHVRSNLVLDVVDGHGYWEHPRLGKETWIKNTPMVNDPLDSTVVQFARTPVAGRPFTISETNHPYPHEYAAEGIPILTAYALLHDWDGIYWFDYGPGRTGNAAKDGIRPYGWFDLSNDPVKMTNLYACAAAWWRQDVAPAKRTVVRAYDDEQIIESLRVDSKKGRPFFTPGFAPSTPLQHATRWRLTDRAAAAARQEDYPPAAPPGEIASDTGELSWLRADRNAGLVTVSTARTAALIGFGLDDGRQAGHLRAERKNRFASVVLASLDARPIVQASKLLLSTTAKATNSGVAWKDDRQTLVDWGRGPTVIEPVTGRVVLRQVGPAKRVHYAPLTAEGRPATEARDATRAGDDWVLPLDGTVTTWYQLEVER